MCHYLHIVSHCTLCQSYYYKTGLMDSVFHNLNLLKFIIQLILHIKIWLSFVVKYIICGGESIFGTTGVGGSHKFQLNKNLSYYYVSSKLETTGIQRTRHLVY